MLKTARMHGIYSQGLAMPASLFPELENLTDGEDIATFSGVLKYEEPIPKNSRHGRRDVPDQLRSEDRAARVQNLEGVFAELRANYDWHLRYVGVDAATDIAARSITLEEYLAAAPQ